VSDVLIEDLVLVSISEDLHALFQHTLIKNCFLNRGCNVFAVIKATVLKFALPQVTEFKIAILKDAVFERNTLKFCGIEGAVGEDHLPVGAQENA
jgi:hypothetical protein